MKSTFGLCLLPLLLLTAEVHGEAAVSKGDITAYFSFDNALHLDYPPANGLDVDGPEPKFGEGKFGRAVYVGKDGGFWYPLTSENYQPSEGTVSLWFKPDWKVEDQAAHWLWGTHWYGVWLNASAARTIASQGSRSIIAPKAISIDGWHHFAVTWSNNQITALYLDGEKFTEVDGRKDDKIGDTAGSRLNIGGHSNPEIPRASGWFDDLISFRRELTSEQVQALYRDGVQSTFKVILQLPRAGFRRGETVAVPVKTVGKASVALIDLRTKHEYPLKGGVWDTHRFRPGEYRLIARSGEDSDTLDVTLRPPEREGIAIGSFAGWEPINEEYLRDFASAGGDHDYLALNGAARKWMDFAYRLGVRLIPNVDAPGIKSRHGDWDPSKYGQRLLAPTGELAGYSTVPCPRNPAALDEMSNHVQSVVRKMKGYPGFFALSLDDEYSLQYTFWNEKYERGCFDENCRSLFRKKTGLELPLKALYRPPGLVAKDDDPYVRWCEINGSAGGNFTAGPWCERPAMQQYGETLAQAAHAVDPNVRVLRLLGGNYGELDAQMPRIYAGGFGEGVSNWAAPELIAAYIVDLNRATQRVKHPPLWAMTGWFRDPPVTDWLKRSMRLLAYLSIARGCQSVDIAPFQFRHKPEIRQVFVEMAQFLRDYGAWFYRFRPASAPVAVLYSELNEQFKQNGRWNADKNAWDIPPRLWHLDDVLQTLYPALLLANVPVEFITDNQIERGELQRYHALFVPTFDYTKESLLRRIEEFAAKGGVVFTEPQCHIQPKGAIQLPRPGTDYVKSNGPTATKEGETRYPADHTNREDMVRQWIPVIQKTMLPHLQPEATLDNTFIAHSLSECDGGRVLNLFNSDLWQDQRVRVTLRNPPAAVYDAVTHSEVQTLHGVFETTVAKGDWKVLALSSQPIAKVTLSATIKGSQIICRLQVTDRAGHPVAGSQPVRLIITDARGEIAPYGGGFATTNGKLTLPIPVAINDSEGKWNVKATELLSGKEETTTFEWHGGTEGI